MFWGNVLPELAKLESSALGSGSLGGMMAVVWKKERKEVGGIKLAVTVGACPV